MLNFALVWLHDVIPQAVVALEIYDSVKYVNNCNVFVNHCNEIELFAIWWFCFTSRKMTIYQTHTFLVEYISRQNLYTNIIVVIFNLNQHVSTFVNCTKQSSWWFELWLAYSRCKSPAITQIKMKANLKWIEGLNNNKKIEHLRNISLNTVFTSNLTSL